LTISNVNNTNSVIDEEPILVQVSNTQHDILSNNGTNSLTNKLTNLSVTILQNDDKASSGINSSDSSQSSSSRLISLNETNSFNNHSKYSKNADENTIYNIKQNRYNKPRTISNSSSFSNENSNRSLKHGRLDHSHNSTSSVNSSGGGSVPTNSTNYFKHLEMSSNCESCCLFCQKENKNQLVACGNENCVGVFCQDCILNYFKNQKIQKCPSCRLNIDREIINDLKEKNSLSPSPTRLNSIQNMTNNNPVYHHQNNNNTSNGFNYNRIKFNNNTNNGHHSLNKVNNSYAKNSVNDAKVYVRVLDEPCDGYEKFKTIMITFELEDGIQNVTFLIEFTKLNLDLINSKN
jgi:hypothetical protein